MDGYIWTCEKAEYASVLFGTWIICYMPTENKRYWGICGNVTTIHQLRYYGQSRIYRGLTVARLYFLRYSDDSSLIGPGTTNAWYPNSNIKLTCCDYQVRVKWMEQKQQADNVPESYRTIIYIS